LPVRQLAALEDRLDMMQVPVLVLVRRFDLNEGGGETALANLVDLQLDWQVKRADAGADRLGIDAGVDERAESHVAADAAETVEMSSSHDGTPVPGCGWPYLHLIAGC